MSDFNNLASYQQEMIHLAYAKIENNIEIKEFLKTYEPPIDRGFMWDNNKIVLDIMSDINDTYGHSGASLAFTMRWLQYIIVKDIQINKN